MKAKNNLNLKSRLKNKGIYITLTWRQESTYVWLVYLDMPCSGLLTPPPPQKKKIGTPHSFINFIPLPLYAQSLR